MFRAYSVAESHTEYHMSYLTGVWHLAHGYLLWEHQNQDDIQTDNILYVWELLRTTVFLWVLETDFS